MSKVLRQSAACAPSQTDGSYVYKIIPSTGNGLALITSADELLLLDRQTLTCISEPPFSSVPGGLTCLEPGDLEGNVVLCAGRDGSVAAFDVRSRGRVSHINLGRAVTALSCRAGDGDVAVGTELARQQAIISVWDRRQNRSKWQTTENSDDITDLHFHPSRTHHLLSGGVDGLVSIFDTQIVDEDESLLQAVNHGPIHKAGFIADDAIYALSHDEQFSIYPVNVDIDDENAKTVSPTLFGDLRPTLRCDYVIDILRVDGNVMVATGSHNSDPRIDLVPVQGALKPAFSISESIRLAGGHGEEIVRSVFVDVQSDTIFSAGEDGQVRAFSVVSDTQQALKSLKPTQPAVQKAQNSRYKPY